MSERPLIPDLDRKGLRDFALLLAGVLAILFGLLLPWFFERDYPLWPWVVGGALVVWGVVAPESVRPVYMIWMRFALLISKVTTPLIMAITFYLIIFPIGYLRRMTGGGPIAKGPDVTASSYRVPSKAITAKDLERPY